MAEGGPKQKGNDVGGVFGTMRAEGVSLRPPAWPEGFRLLAVPAHLVIGESRDGEFRKPVETDERLSGVALRRLPVDGVGLRVAERGNRLFEKRLRLAYLHAVEGAQTLPAEDAEEEAGVVECHAHPRICRAADGIPTP